MQRITLGIGTAFQPMEDKLRDAFLPELFKGSTPKISRIVVTGLPIKQAGIALPDPTHTSKANRAASCVITGHLVAALCRMVDFQSKYHALLMRDVRDEIF